MNQMNEEKQKDPKRVAAGKKGAEIKKLKNEMKKKENEKYKFETSITRPEEEETKINYEQYLPYLIGGGVGIIYLFFYMNKKSVIIKKEEKPTKKEEIDPFEI